MLPKFLDKHLSKKNYSKSMQIEPVDLAHKILTNPHGKWRNHVKIVAFLLLWDYDLQKCPN